MILTKYARQHVDECCLKFKNTYKVSETSGDAYYTRCALCRNITADTRWSYANVWEPKSINGGTPKYSVSLIIPKSDTKTVAKIKAAIEAAYVSDLLMVEMREREANRINRMVKTAGFQVLKTLDDFEWKSDLELPAGLTREYMEDLQFLAPKENLVFMGAVGTGKTHLATALALKACQEGRRVYKAFHNEKSTS